MTRKQVIAFRVLFSLYVLGVLLLCFCHFDSTPNVPKMLWGIPTDKLVHFCMFFPFPILSFLAFDQFTVVPGATYRFVALTFVAGFLLALGTEWGQAHLTTYRAGDPMDLLADTLALAVSCIGITIWDLRKQRR